uniref:Major facilitator superfamily (MFS) profile domain-containing protein n=1 Tax=Clastoptera arizonana TaxID=38151 RepID=A0A1B6D578_9HEMI
MDLDVILQDLGQFGKYQILSYALLFFPVIFSSFPVLSYVFTTSHLNYRCYVPECENKTEPLTFEPTWLPIAVPYTNNQKSSCERFKPVAENNSTCLAPNFMRNVTEKCEDYVFEDSSNSIVTDFDMICEDNDWKRTSIGSINNVAQFIGLPFAGFISDRFGRRTMLVTVTVLSAIMGVLRSFSVSYVMFAVFEFCDALVGGNIYSACFILGLEIVGPKKRMFGSIVLSCFFCIGEALLGATMWYFKDWRILLRVIYTPGLFIIIYAWIVPESIRWLVTKGFNKKAVEIVRKIAKVNNRNLPEQVANDLESMPPKGEVTLNKESDTKCKTEATYKPGAQKNSAFSKVFKSKPLLLRLINCSFCWMANTLVYYGLSLNSISVGGNRYYNFILVSLVEIPAYVITMIFTEHFGRRISLCGSLVVSGAACIAFYFVETDMLTARLVLYMTGKLAITMSFTVIYIYTAEMFPTELRHSLLATCSMFGRIGSMIAPQTPLLATYVEPLTVFGMVSLLGAGLSLTFPETLNTKLPDTIEEAEDVGVRK